LSIVSLSVGACLCVATACADVVLGSGYDRFKESIKTAAGQMEQGLDNYTMKLMYSIKDDGKTLAQNALYQKTDVKNKKTEETSTIQEANRESFTFYSYADSNQSISKNQREDTYFVTKYDDSEENRHFMFESPFKEQRFQEMEKIIDALVGNLKEHVQAEERPEGGKVYAGSL